LFHYIDSLVQAGTSIISRKLIVIVLHPTCCLGWYYLWEVQNNSRSLSISQFPCYNL